jgi:hypothetical protein
MKGRNNSDGSFDWKGAIADALVSAGYAGFAALLALGIATPTDALAVLPKVLIVAGTQFFLVLGTKRGLVEKPKA